MQLTEDVKMKLFLALTCLAIFGSVAADDNSSFGRLNYYLFVNCPNINKTIFFSYEK